MSDLSARAYWTAQMDAADAFMRRIYAYPVAECLEPLVSLPDAAAEAGVEIACSDLPHAGGAARIFMLRKGLILAFLAAAREMNDRGWMIKLEDVFRTTAMQRYNARRDDVFLHVLKITQWECGLETPPLELLTRRMGALIAAAPRVGTHLCGSAMDISVLHRDTGAEVDRGAPYIEMSIRTPMDSPYITDTGRRNRETITALMAHHGFVTYPWEFWHYNAGDAYAEVLNDTGRPARYGPVHVDVRDGRVTPIEHPEAPLNAPEEIEALLRRALV